MTIKSTLRSEQLTLLSDYPAIRLSALPVLDQRLRGTTFVALAPRSILNSPQQTGVDRSEEHTSELQSQSNLVCRLLLEKKKTHIKQQVRFTTSTRNSDEDEYAQHADRAR